MKISFKTIFTITIWAATCLTAAITTAGRPDNIFILLWVSIPFFCLVVTFLLLDLKNRTPETNGKTGKN